MRHRLEILDIRDRYMIGDWVLNNGKPYRWTADDYNRSKMGMEAIKPMSLTEGILEKNDWELEGLFWIHKDVMFEIIDGVMYELPIKFNYVHELQDALRTCKLYDLAEDFKV